MPRLLAGLVLWSSLAAQTLSDRTTLLAKFHTKTAYSGLWGYSAPDGREFALVGEVGGLWIVEVTDPRNPREIAYYPAPNNRWRESTSFGTYVYSVSEGHGGFRTIDMRDPESPRDLGYLLPFQWGNAHTVSLDAEAGRVYVNGTHLGMQILDVRTNPERPALLGIHAGDFVHDSHHRRGRSYLSHYYTGKLRIVNNTNPQSLVTLGTLTTPGNLTHDAWVTDDDKLLLTTDENSSPQEGFLQAWDVSAPSIPRKLGAYTVPGHIVHNVTIVGPIAYVAWHGDGVHVLDLGDPTQLRRIAWYDTSTQTTGLNGAWSTYPFLDSGTLLASDIQEGLFTLRVEVGHMNRFGKALPGASGRPPRIQLRRSAPRVGATGFEVELVDLPPSQPFALALSSGGADLAVGGIRIYVDLTQVLVVSGQADAKGRAVVPAPIPAQPALADQKVWMQVVASDPAAPLGVAYSRGHWFGVAP